jgi:hypothetical protein
LPGVDRHQQRLALHHQGGQARVVHQRRGADEAQVEPVREQVVDLRLRGLLAQVERNLWPGGAEIAQQARHHIGEGHGPGESHRQPPGVAASGMPGLRGGVLHRVENIACQRQQGVARCGALHPAAPACEQGHAEFGLQGLNLLAQRRLRDMQALRCAGEMAFFGNGNKVAEVAQVHIENRSKLRKMIFHISSGRL